MKIKIKKLVTLENILVTSLLLISFFVRVYRLDQLIGFYFDQGRDAMVIWNLWHGGKFFLIGPVTGLEGIFLGPFYYYLIAPFYLIGGGNPVFPAVFLSFLSTIALYLLYRLGKIIHSKEAGFLALVIGGFSYSLVLASRWLSNPTPILLTSVIIFLSLWKIMNKGKDYWWAILAFTVGASLHFESASAVFYLPMILVFSFWQRKALPKRKYFLMSMVLFALTLLPQAIFNFRHENILVANVIKTFFSSKGFALNFWKVLPERINYFVGNATSLIFPHKSFLNILVFALSGLGLFSLWKKNRKLLILFVIFLGSPIVGITLFQGNFGNIYDYYLTGYFLPFILLFSLGLTEITKNNLGKIAVVLFLVIFLLRNGVLVKNYIIAGADGPTHISLGNEMQAVNWILSNAVGRGKPFNVDVYVPPVIPHAYDYLFLWQATKKCGESLCGMEKEKRVDTLYTLYEVDPPHPERLEAWLKRQAGIGKVLEETKFGGITVQRRQRLLY